MIEIIRLILAGVVVLGIFAIAGAIFFALGNIAIFLLPAAFIVAAFMMNRS